MSNVNLFSHASITQCKGNLSCANLVCCDCEEVPASRSSLCLASADNADNKSTAPNDVDVPEPVWNGFFRMQTLSGAMKTIVPRSGTAVCSNICLSACQEETRKIEKQSKQAQNILTYQANQVARKKSVKVKEPKAESTTTWSRLWSLEIGHALLVSFQRWALLLYLLF